MEIRTKGAMQMTMEQLIAKRTARIDLLEQEEMERALQDAADWRRAEEEEFHEWLSQTDPDPWDGRRI